MIQKQLQIPKLMIPKAQEKHKGDRGTLKLPQISIGMTLNSPKYGKASFSRLHSKKTTRKLQSPQREYSKPKTLHSENSLPPPTQFPSPTSRSIKSKEPYKNLLTQRNSIKELGSIRNSGKQEEDPIKEIYQQKDYSPQQSQKNGSPIRLKNESVSSEFTQPTDEYFSIWDNMDLNMRGVVFDEMEQQEKIQQFLNLYKMRSGGFPGQRENIPNEKVIQVAVEYAMQNKQLFKKYFPKNQVVFENEEDYSRSYDCSKDPNFQKFQQYIEQKKKQQ